MDDMHTTPCEHPSSVNNMSVANVRRALAQMRSLWSEHSPETPLNLTAQLFNGMTVAHFAMLFVMGHHSKRHAKTESPQD